MKVSMVITEWEEDRELRLNTESQGMSLMLLLRLEYEIQGGRTRVLMTNTTLRLQPGHSFRLETYLARPELNARLPRN